MALSFGFKFPNRVKNLVYGPKFACCLVAWGLSFPRYSVHYRISQMLTSSFLLLQAKRKTSNRGGDVDIPPPPSCAFSLFVSISSLLLCALFLRIVFCNLSVRRTRPSLSEIDIYRHSWVPSLSSSRQSFGSVSTGEEKGC